MFNKLNETQTKILNKIKELSVENNVNMYIVGGVVRDFILNKQIKDIDFLIEGSAVDFAKQSNLKIKSVHESFNTVKVEIEGTGIDIASTRKENYPNPGCLPNVTETGIKIEEDLKRRDFTVNSIALNINTNEIIDPFSGKNDIKNKILKVLHDKSFIDDPTRILRGLDFKYRFNFDFDIETKNLIQKATENYNNENLSIDRIYLTLNKIFSSENPSKILEDIIRFEIYKIWMKRTDLKIEEISSLDEISDIFNVKEKNKLFIIALESIPYFKAPLNNSFEIYQFFKSFKPEQLALYYFKTKDNSALEYLKIKDIKPLINGSDILNEGFMQGEIIGTILNAILKEKISNPENLKTVEEELNFVRKNFKQQA